MQPSPSPLPIHPIQATPFQLPFSPQQLADFEKILHSRIVQNYFRWMTTPEFSHDLSALINHPHRSWMIYLELGWLLVLFVFRSSRLSKLSASNWPSILWLNVWTFFAYWIGAIVFPFFLFGGPYRRLATGLWRVLVG